MQILLIGQGAREHALAWKLSQSPRLTRLWTWPGNAAIAGLAETLPLPAELSYHDLAAAARAQGIELVVCGPEVPLAEGLHDIFAAYGLPVFGPCQKVAALESSKAFAKEIMAEAGIPTAAFRLGGSATETRRLAESELSEQGVVVLKASGLASGKGVFICRTLPELDEALVHLYSPAMQAASSLLVVESCLTGREASYFSLIGESSRASLGFAVDFKRAEEGDAGPNTGGMGAYTPVPWLPADATALVEARIVEPLCRALAARGLRYQGFLYVGLMWTATGPSVIEFNVRLGDPEAQVLAVHDSRDWLALMLEVMGQSKVGASSAAWLPSPERTERSVAIVMASRSYPFGTQDADELSPQALPDGIFTGRQQRPDEAFVFAGAIRKAADHLIYPSSGRVLTVVAQDSSFAAARAKALAHAAAIGAGWSAGKWRRDIAARVALEETHASSYSPR